MNTYYVYILTTRYNKLLYIWVTNNVQRRLYEHKNKLIDGFTKRYNIDKLIYYEEYSDIKDAIAREKQLKWRTRKKKDEIVKKTNPTYDDISNNWS